MESLNGLAVTDSVIRQCIFSARLPNSHICPSFLIEALIAFSRYNQRPLDGGAHVAVAVVRVLCLGEFDVCWQRGVLAGLCGWFHQPECSREILHPHSMSEWQCAACEKGRLMLGDLHAVHVFIWQEVSEPELWNCLQSIVSQNHPANRSCTCGWRISALIGAHCQIVAFSWKTVVAQQFRDRKKV